MAEILVGYFLEDVGQENFLRSLVERVAQEMGWTPQGVGHRVQNATGGRGVVLDELRRFLRDVSRERDQPFALLVVAIDGDCRGYREIRDAIQTIAQRSGYPGPLACAVPDPHIERWYLADSLALRQVLDANTIPQVPAYKCERGRYKQALRDAIRQTGIIAPLGGLEYGSDIAETPSTCMLLARPMLVSNTLLTSCKQGWPPLQVDRRDECDRSPPHRTLQPTGCHQCPIRHRHISTLHVW